MHLTKPLVVSLAGACILGAAPAAHSAPDEPVALVPSDVRPEQRFGFALATDGARLLIGSINDSDAGFRAGAAYVFRRDGAQWVEEAELSDPLPRIGAGFGTSVGLSGDIAVIGTREDAGHPGVGGALVFRRVGHAWSHEAMLRPPDVDPPGTAFGYYAFGTAVAADAGRVVVTMPQDDIACPDDPLCNSGSAYVFVHDGSGWVMEQKLIPSDPQQLAHFGRSAAILGDRIVIGAFQADDLNGAVYVFRRDGGAWVEEAKLANPDASPGVPLRFGDAVAIDEGLIAVGAPGDQHAGAYSGAAYTFRLGPGGWAHEARLVPADPHETQFFGQSIATEGGRLLVGAPWDDHDGSWLRAGAVYVFEHGTAGWDQGAKRIAPEPQDEAIFGWSVAMGPGVDAVGAQTADAPLLDCGVVYVYADACAADFDGDGMLSPADFAAFRVAFLAGDDRADFDGDGDLTPQDFAAFRAAFLAGCG